MISLLLLGFLLGVRHALEADHIATVAALASQRTTVEQMLKQGFAWGLGHSLTILLLAGGVMWLGANISSVVATGLETLVGILMVLLGIDVVRRALNTRYHIHFHLHSHTQEQLRNHERPNTHRHQHKQQGAYPFRALSLGLVHGLAGSAAILLLVVEQMDSVTVGFIYLGLFCIGSMVGMLVFSALISVPIMLSNQRFKHWQTYLQILIGIITLGIGGQIGLAGLMA